MNEFEIFIYFKRDLNKMYTKIIGEVYKK